MKAVVMHERGGAEVLRYESFPTPQPGPGEVLIQVQAASVNHTDIFHRTGQFYIQKALPHILGMDVSGQIVELGEGVKDWNVGDRVTATFEALGRERNGAYAEYTTLPVGELYHIPEELDYVNAASIGLAFTTAWIAFFRTDKLQTGEQVVIQAASSGVGTAAVQIAHWQGAQVIGICESRKAEQVKYLGAGTVIDRHAPDVVQQVMAATNNKGASFVLDLVGRTTIQSSIDILSDRGKIISVGTLSGDVGEVNLMDLIMKRGTLKGSFEKVQRADFEKILHLFAQGTFQPVIDSVLPLQEAKAAHQRIEAKQAFGKIILVPS